MSITIKKKINNTLVYVYNQLRFVFRLRSFLVQDIEMAKQFRRILKHLNVDNGDVRIKILDIHSQRIPKRATIGPAGTVPAITYVQISVSTY